MDDIKAKQQIVDKIKSSTNILVTVSNNPSVDALSAALGLTLLLDKLEKHPTAVFSGEVPPAISFLEPEKTFDSTTDSLRDFIIALDKEKADHLRYKVEGESVRIFITPYKTTITSDDLTFSQGDFNVELVIALGVDVQEHLDGALESHGQILHDAAIITVTAGQQTSKLGGIDWHDEQASSLSEMISGLAEALKTDKNKSLLDAEISTAFLTGIVAETDRFSNTHTTSRVMTMAAQLMAAGADQQLIASKLQESHEIGNSPAAKPVEAPKEPEHSESLSITHKQGETLEELDKRVKQAEQAEAAVVATESLASAAGAYAMTDEPSDEPSVEQPVATAPVTPEVTPTATLTGAYAAEPLAETVETSPLITHSYLDTAAGASPSSATGAGSSYVLGHDQPVTVEEAVETPAVPPTPTPTDLGLPMPPAVPDFSAPPAMAPAYAVEAAPAAQPELLGDILATEPAAAPILPTAPVVAPTTPPSDDAGQFKIPGQ